MSVFDWQTGQPSIFASLQKDANIAKKNLSAKLGTRPDPVNLPKKKTRNRTRKTIPLQTRIDFNEVRAHRLAGKSWEECAAHFKASSGSMQRVFTCLFPELKHGHMSQLGRRRKPLPIAEIIDSVMGGVSLRAMARKHEIAVTTLTYRLRQTPEGLAAIAAAQRRLEESNAALKEKARKRREVQ
jgi:hypothetical protein